MDEKGKSLKSLLKGKLRHIKVSKSVGAHICQTWQHPARSVRSLPVGSQWGEGLRENMQEQSQEGTWLVIAEVVADHVPLFGKSCWLLVVGGP